MSKITEAVRESIEPIIEKEGCELVDVEFVERRGEATLWIYVWNAEGTSLDVCERVHNAIDPVLDSLDVLDRKYTLNVSSPGLDRSLTTDADFRRNLGQLLEIRFFAPQDGKKMMEGVLNGYDETALVLLVEKEEVRVEREKIAKASIAIKF